MDDEENMKKWIKKDSEKIVETPWFALSKNKYLLPESNREIEYYISHEKDSAIIITETTDGKILLVKQYRPIVDGVVYDFPAGYLEEGDSNPLERAKKELLKETGYRSDEWIDLGYVYPLPNRVDKKDHIFYAKGIEKVANQDLDENEQIEYEEVSVERFEQMIRSNEFTCAVCIAGYYKSKL